LKMTHPVKRVSDEKTLVWSNAGEAEVGENGWVGGGWFKCRYPIRREGACNVVDEEGNRGRGGNSGSEKKPKKRGRIFSKTTPEEKTREFSHLKT